jgi:hypothetical protein
LCLDHWLVQIYVEKAGWSGLRWKRPKRRSDLAVPSDGTTDPRRVEFAEQVRGRREHACYLSSGIDGGKYLDQSIERLRPGDRRGEVGREKLRAYQFVDKGQRLVSGDRRFLDRKCVRKCANG